MDYTSPTHKPVISSQLSAENTGFQLRQLNKLKPIDADGLEWELKFHQFESPHPDHLNKLRWSIMIQLKTKASKQDLINTGTLDINKDSRLLSLLSDFEPITFSLRPIKILATDEKEAQNKVKKIIPEYINKIENTSLHDLKKKVIGESISNKRQFCEIL